MRLARNRKLYFIALLIVIFAGLGSRKWGASLPRFIAENAGDSLWTVAVFLTLAIIFPKTQPIRLGLASLGISIAVEFSQLIDMEPINTLRKTLPGRLLLGRGFLWLDLARYATGAIFAVFLDQLLIHLKTQKP